MSQKTCLTRLGVRVLNPSPEIIENSILEFYNSYLKKELYEQLALESPKTKNLWFIPRGAWLEEPETYLLNTNFLEKRLNKSPDYEMTPNQRTIAQYLWDNYFSKNSAGITLKAGTGIGKTFIALMLIRRRKSRALVIIPDISNVDNWNKQINVFLPENNISVIGGKTSKNKKDEDAPLTIITIHSAMNRNPAFFKKFGFIVFDEVHEYASKKRTEIFKKAASRWMLAMTATPSDRLDKRDGVYQKLVGPLLDVEEIPNYDKEEAKFKGTVRVIRYPNPPEFSEIAISPETKKPSHFATIKKCLIADDNRCKLIIWETLKLYERNEHVFVFGDLIELLEKLYKIAQECPKFDNSHLCLLHSNTITKEELKKAEEEYRVLFVISSIFKKGISFSKKTSITFGNPFRTGANQKIGRITRTDYDINHERTTIDILDTNIPMYWSQFKSKANKEGERKPCRWDEYVRRGWKIIYVDYNPEEINLN